MPTRRPAAPSATLPPAPAVATDMGLPAGYGDLLESIKADVRTARVRAALAANGELIALYWRIGRLITDRQAGEPWGTAVLERLAADLRSAFPGVSGFSRANLFRIRAFYQAWADAGAIVAQPARQLANDDQAVVGQQLDSTDPPEFAARLPWFHNVVLVERLKDPAARRWYAMEAVDHGWSRSVLDLQIRSRLHERQGRAVTNFARTLPAPESDLAEQVLRDPYLFGFLGLGPEAHERDVEQALATHVERFLLALGAGFAFVGRQVPLDVGGEEFRLDLLFYHLRLRCYVVLELKAVGFRPEFAGKLNFYLSAVDDLMRHPGDRPSIGLLLCRGKNRVTVEYALRDLGKPIGVADWDAQLTASLPEELKGSLPTVEELERELGTPTARDGA